MKPAMTVQKSALAIGKGIDVWTRQHEASALPAADRKVK
jgi:hypothetical protein